MAINADQWMLRRKIVTFVWLLEGPANVRIHVGIAHRDVDQGNTQPSQHRNDLPGLIQVGFERIVFIDTKTERIRDGKSSGFTYLGGGVHQVGYAVKDAKARGQ